MGQIMGQSSKTATKNPLKSLISEDFCVWLPKKMQLADGLYLLFRLLYVNINSHPNSNVADLL